MTLLAENTTVRGSDQALQQAPPPVGSKPVRASAATAGVEVRFDLPPELRVGADSRPPSSAEQPRKRSRWLRPAVLLRVLAVLGVAGLASWHLGDRFLLASSLDAVVSAPLIPMRAPLDGRVLIDAVVEPGAAVGAGQPLFTLTDDLVDERALADMGSRVDTLDDAERASADRMAVLEALKASLRERADLYRDSTVRRLTAMFSETEVMHKSARIQASLSRVELARTRDLAGRGVQSAVRLEEVEAASSRATLEGERLGASAERLHAELESARRGVVIGEGFADAPYSQQRLDEIGMRLADLAVERAALSGSRRELVKRLGTEARRVRMLRKETVAAPAAGLIWSLGVTDGARVSRGDVLGEVADCAHSYVEATLPARGFDTVRPGDKVRVRLSGRLLNTGEEIPGTVRSLRGAGPVGSVTRAASLERSGNGLITVVVDVAPAALAATSAGTCQIGRSAKVLF